MWNLKGQQVMIPTSGQPDTYYGIGAVNYHTGETVVQFHRRKRRTEMAELLKALVSKHPTGTIDVVWDNASLHADEEIEVVVRAAAGRLVLLYLPTYSPWLNPIEMLWRHFRREVTHCELFPMKQALLTAAQALLRPLQPVSPKDFVSYWLQNSNHSVIVLSNRPISSSQPCGRCS